MAWGLLRIHVIVLIPVVLSYHLRTSVSSSRFLVVFGGERVFAGKDTEALGTLAVIESIQKTGNGRMDQ